MFYFSVASGSGQESDPANTQYTGQDQDGINMLRETGGISYSTYLQVRPLSNINALDLYWRFTKKKQWDQMATLFAQYLAI